MRTRDRHSITLESNAQHLLTDVWTTAGVIVGVGAVAATGYLRLDPIVAGWWRRTSCGPGRASFEDPSLVDEVDHTVPLIDEIPGYAPLREVAPRRLRVLQQVIEAVAPLAAVHASDVSDSEVRHLVAAATIGVAPSGN